MKNNLTTGILAIAIVVLYILQFSSGNSSDKINADNLEPIESLVKDSITKPISLSDTLNFDSLKEADYSRIGFINMFQVVDQCPTLKKDIQLLEQKQISLQKKEAQIYKEFETYRAKKEQDLK